MCRKRRQKIFLLGVAYNTEESAHCWVTLFPCSCAGLSLGNDTTRTPPCRSAVAKVCTFVIGCNRDFPIFVKLGEKSKKGGLQASLFELLDLCRIVKDGNDETLVLDIRWLP